jgi:hypothetical protein
MSRQSGSLTEYLVARSLISLGHRAADDGYTRARLVAMSKGYKRDTAMEKKVEQGLVCIIPANQRYTFSLNPDTSGSSSSSQRTTSDIVVHGPTPINISVKHNNLSLKHQKADKLWCQMRMCESRKQQFIGAYEKLCSLWISENETTSTYADLPPGAKTRLYNGINSLILKNLVTAPTKDVRNYLDFILDLPTQNKYIIKCNTTYGKQSVEMLQLCVPNTALPTKIKRVGNFIELDLGPLVQVRLRLHSCTTNIKSKLDLKYDTQIKGGLVSIVKL